MSTVTTERIFADHRQCGSTNGYDGCYSHPVSGGAHCRQDGMEWPCDVNLLSVPLAWKDRHYETAIVALEQIKREEGKVCDQYEICEHRACQSSYAAWAIADATLRTLGFDS
jgi:hypothetical protein